MLAMRTLRQPVPRGVVASHRDQLGGPVPLHPSPTTFETIPFPEGLSPDMPASDYVTDPRAQAIASATRRLGELRDRWLDPPEWVERVEEPVPGYPRRPIPA